MTNQLKMDVSKEKIKTIPSYYTNAEKRIIHEVQTLEQIGSNSGFVCESVVYNFFSLHLPNAVNVLKSSLLVDVSDSQSDELDILIVSNNAPRFPVSSYSEMHLIPIESCNVVIEVKKSATETNFNDCVKKFNKVKKLKIQPDSGYGFSNENADRHPICAVVMVSAPISTEIADIKEWLAHDPDKSVDIVVILGVGCWIKDCLLPSADATAFSPGLGIGLATLSMVASQCLSRRCTPFPKEYIISNFDMKNLEGREEFIAAQYMLKYALETPSRKYEEPVTPQRLGIALQILENLKKEYPKNKTLEKVISQARSLINRNVPQQEDGPIESNIFNVD